MRSILNIPPNYFDSWIFITFKIEAAIYLSKSYFDIAKLKSIKQNIINRNSKILSNPLESLNRDF